MIKPMISECMTRDIYKKTQSTMACLAHRRFIRCVYMQSQEKSFCTEEHAWYERYVQKCLSEVERERKRES